MMPTNQNQIFNYASLVLLMSSFLVFSSNSSILDTGSSSDASSTFKLVEAFSCTNMNIHSKSAVAHQHTHVDARIHAKNRISSALSSRTKMNEGNSNSDDYQYHDGSDILKSPPIAVASSTNIFKSTSTSTSTSTNIITNRRGLFFFDHQRQQTPPAVKLAAGTLLFSMLLDPITISSFPAHAKSSIKPDQAFSNLVKAREELSVAYNTYILKKDYEGLRKYVNEDAINMNNYEENANVLLASKQLDAESKIAIGTVRRYGAGADVIIMYGGLKGEISEDVEEEDINYGAVSKAIRRTMDSLDEVISICRSNGF